MKPHIRRVSGAQASQARSLGLVKITKNSANLLFDAGVPLVVVGTNVNSFHFFGGWHLAMHVDTERYLNEGQTFDRLVNSWSAYNENPETGKMAFFVDPKEASKKGWLI
jgi:hypothetical protein